MRLIRSKIHEEPFKVAELTPHPATRGVKWSEAGMLRGYVEVEARSTAEVILSHPETKHPIMVTWRYGLGNVVAMATDAGPRWASSWLTWLGYDRFWTQLSRWALAQSDDRDTSVAVEFEGGSHKKMWRA